MAALEENAITRVATVESVDMQTAGVTSLYTVPAGKTFVPILVVVREVSASLAGGTDYDFGTTAGCSDWRQTVDLSALTTVADKFVVIYASDATQYTEQDAGEVFGIKVSTGSTGAATATIDVYGYLS